MNVMNKMIINHSEVEKVDMGKGVVRQDFAMGKNMNVLHWNMSDGSEVGMHTHPQEQFGYVIKGGFRLTIGEEVYELSEGDAYLVPADVPHGFVAVGEAEAFGEACADLESQGYKRLFDPVPVRVLGGRRICYFHHPAVGYVELVSVR